MKILLVLPRFLPGPGTTGSMVLVWSLIQSAIELGHQVACFAYDLDRKKGKDWSNERRALEGIGVHVHVASPLADWEAEVSNRWLRTARTVAFAIRPDWPSICPNPLHVERAVRGVLDSEQPDVVWTYMLTPTAIVSRMARRPPVLSSVVDLEWKAKDHVAESHAGKAPREVFARLTARKSARLLERLEPDLLRGADDLVSHAASSTRWYATRDLRADYVPVPVADSAGPNWRERRQAAQVDGFRVGHVGRLDGLHTKFGLRFLLGSVLPELRRRVPDASVHVVGGGAPPADIAVLFREPGVVVRGFVADIGEELAALTALAVPIDIDLGFRVRIAEAFAHGVPVVAHRKACAGMPEVVHDENALLVDDAIEMARELERLSRDVGLRERLSMAARSTFERHYDARIVGRTMVERMERLVEGTARTNASTEQRTTKESR